VTGFILAKTEPRFALGECLGFRGHTHLVQREAPWTVMTSEVGFLEAGSARQVLSRLHTLHNKVPVTAPDVLGVDPKAGNCVTASLLVFKSPVSPKMVVVPFNVGWGGELAIVPDFDFGPDWADLQQCSLTSLIRELERSAKGKYVLAEIVDSFAILVRADLVPSSLVGKLVDYRDEFLAASRYSPVGRKVEEVAGDSEFEKRVCASLEASNRTIRLLSIENETFLCDGKYRTPVKRPREEAKLWRYPPGVLRNGECDEKECVCHPPFTGILCAEIVDTFDKVGFLTLTNNTTSLTIRARSSQEWRVRMPEMAVPEWIAADKRLFSSLHDVKRSLFDRRKEVFLATAFKFPPLHAFDRIVVVGTKEEVDLEAFRSKPCFRKVLRKHEALGSFWLQGLTAAELAREAAEICPS
jgi:hypothetical protein